MTETNEGRTTPKRRRYSREFKTAIIAACQNPGISIAQVARQHDLNANQVQNWIAQARKEGWRPETADFVSLLPAVSQHQDPPMQKDSVIRILFPTANGTLTIEWPSAQASQCLALLRSLLS